MKIEAVPRGKRSLRQHVTEALRQAIITGELAPGDRIVEEEVAEQMDISRGPIREALRELEQEGLVMSWPYRGAVVVEITTEEVLKVLIPIRATLEEYALDHALEKFTPEDVRELEAIVDAMTVAAKDRDLARLVEYDMEFHRSIMRTSGQFHCLQLWELIAPRIRGVFFRMTPKHSSLTAIPGQHRKLLDALESGDKQLAHGVLLEHIRDSKLYGLTPKAGA